MIEWEQKLSRAILYRAAKDMTKRNDLHWLVDPHVNDLCKKAGLEYDQFVIAIKFLLDKSDTQRKVLLRSMKKNLGV